jgi:hypothetical protein
MAIEGSLAASPTMLQPFASTLTCMLTKPSRIHRPQCSIGVARLAVV